MSENYAAHIAAQRGAGPFGATSKRGLPLYPQFGDGFSGPAARDQQNLKGVSFRQTIGLIAALKTRAQVITDESAEARSITGEQDASKTVALTPAIIRPGLYIFPSGWQGSGLRENYPQVLNAGGDPNGPAIAGVLSVFSADDQDPFIGPDSPNLQLGTGGDNNIPVNRSRWRFEYRPLYEPATGAFRFSKVGATGDKSEWVEILSAAGHVAAAISDADFPADPAAAGNNEARTVAPSRRSTWQAIKDLLTFFITTSEVWIAVIGGDSGNAALPDSGNWQDLPNPEHRENKGADEIRVTTSGAGFNDNGPYTADTAAIKLASTTEDGDGVVIHSENMAFLHVRWLAADEKFQINTLGPDGANINFGANITVAEVEFFFAQPITAAAAELVDLQHKVEALENQQRGIVFHVRRFVEAPKGTNGDNLRLTGGTFPANFRGKQDLTQDPVVSVAEGDLPNPITVHKAFPANYDEANSEVFQFSLVYDSDNIPAADAAWTFEGQRDPATAEETVGLVTVDVVGGNSGVARLDDKAMPVAIPLPYDLVAGDLAGVLNGEYDLPGTGAVSIPIAPIDPTTLPLAKPDENNVSLVIHAVDPPFAKMWKDGDEIKFDDAPNDAAGFFTSLTIQISVAKAAELGLTEPEQDYGTTAEELLGDAQTAVLTERRIAFAAGAGGGPGEPTTTPFNQPGTRQLTAAEVAVINAAGNDGSKTRISGAITWEPGAYAGFAPEPASVAVQVGRAEVGGANPVAADFETVGTISNMLSGAERDFSFPIPASAVAKGRDVRLVFTVMTEGGALAHNAFAVSDVIVSEKGNSVDRVIALAKSALSGSIALINAAITAIRKRVTQNEEDITALSQRQPLSLSATILGFLSRIGLKHDAGTEIWRYPWDGGAWFNGDADGTNGTAANPIASLVAAGTEAGATLRVSNDGPGNLLRLTTPNNEIHKTLHLRRLKSLGNNTLVWLVIPGLGALPFLRSVVEAPADGGAHYLIDHPDGGSRGFTIRRNGLDSAVVPMMMDDSFDISLTPGPVDHTDASYVITLIREDGTKIELGTLEAPHNTLARLRFNDIAFDMVDPTDPNSKMKFWQNAGILHHQGVYISHAHLAELDLAYEKTADGAVVSTFFGQRSISPGQEYNTINGDLEILTGPFVVPEGKIKTRKADGTLVDFAGGGGGVGAQGPQGAEVVQIFRQVAHNAAAPAKPVGGAYLNGVVTPPAGWSNEVGAFDPATHDVYISTARANPDGNVLGAWGTPYEGGAEIGETGPPGPVGPQGWSPLYRLIVNGNDHVFQLYDYAGGTGAKPAVPAADNAYLGTAGLGTLANALNMRGTAGQNGANGTNGWSPLYRIVADEERRVFQLYDYTGGTGDKPAVPAAANAYLGAAGLGALANAIDVRGPAGAAGGGGGGGGGGGITISDRIDVLDNLRAGTGSKAPNDLPPVAPIYDFDLTNAVMLLARVTGTGGQFRYGAIAAQRSSDGTWVEIANDLNAHLTVRDDGFTLSTNQAYENFYAVMSTGGGGGTAADDPNLHAFSRKRLDSPDPTYYLGAVGAGVEIADPTTDARISYDAASGFLTLGTAAATYELARDYERAGIDFGRIVYETEFELRDLQTQAAFGFGMNAALRANFLRQGTSGISFRFQPLNGLVEVQRHDRANNQFLNKTTGAWGARDATLPAENLFKVGKNIIKFATYDGLIYAEVNGTPVINEVIMAETPDLSGDHFGDIYLGQANALPLTLEWTSINDPAARDLFQQPAAEGGNLPALAEDGSDKQKVVAANDAGDGYVLRAENAGGGYTITDLFTNAGVAGQQNLSASIKGHKWVNVECLSGGAVFSGRHRGAAVDARVGEAGTGGVLRVAGNVYVAFGTENTVELRNVANNLGHAALLTYVGVEN